MVELEEIDVISVQRYLEHAKIWLIADSRSFWSACAAWLLPQGYALFMSRFPGELRLPSPEWTPTLPYALSYSTYIPTANCIYNYTPRNLHAIAQDSQNRHVVIRTVAKAFHERSIYELLLKSPELYDCHRFPSIIPPIEIITTNKSFDLVVLPRWGINPLYKSPSVSSPFATVSEALYFISSMLAGLRFLHSHRIVHRDLKPENMLINLFDYTEYHAPAGLLSSLRAGVLHEPVRYCLMDFNLSVIFPPELPLEECRLKIGIMSHGTMWYAPPSLAWSDLVYDPFAYDVACLGGIFVKHLRCLIPKAPLLAPLFDRMTTHVLSERLTAAEAYEFSQMIRSSLSQDELNALMPAQDSCPTSEGVSWTAVDESVLQSWASYRTPSFTVFERILSWLGNYTIGTRFVRFCRLWFQYHGRHPAFYTTGYEDWS